jgi:hypothetical protein
MDLADHSVAHKLLSEVPATGEGPVRVDARERLYRYLLALAAISMFADRDNDQRLRMELIATWQSLAQWATSQKDELWVQVSRCGLPRELQPLMELGYTLHDWPLIHALRELALMRDMDRLGAPGLARLVSVPRDHASRLKHDPERAGRLLAAAASGLIALGDTAEARTVATQSVALLSTLQSRFAKLQRSELDGIRNQFDTGHHTPRGHPDVA